MICTSLCSMDCLYCCSTSGLVVLVDILECKIKHVPFAESPRQIDFTFKLRARYQHHAYIKYIVHAQHIQSHGPTL
jgi:hypothetical protein